VFCEKLNATRIAAAMTWTDRLRDAWACETCRRYRRMTLVVLGLLIITLAIG
jgi:hypothetical protein